MLGMSRLSCSTKLHVIYVRFGNDSGVQPELQALKVSAFSLLRKKISCDKTDSQLVKNGAQRTHSKVLENDNGVPNVKGSNP